MQKDFVSILDLMPGVFSLKEYEPLHVFKAVNHTGGRSLFQYDVTVNEEGQKQLTFVNREYEQDEVKRRLLDDDFIINQLTTEDNHRRHTERQVPYVVQLTYDVPEILEVYYLRQCEHVDYVTEAYLRLIENIYYHYVLGYVRSCEDADEIIEHDYATDKSNNRIYRYLEEYDKIIQLDTEDDAFASTVSQKVCEHAETLEACKRLSQDDKLEMGFIFCPSKDLEDALEYGSFLSNIPARHGGYNPFTGVLPLMILHIATARDRGKYKGSSYEDYRHMMRNMPMRIEPHANTLPDIRFVDNLIEEEYTVKENNNIGVLAYKMNMLHMNRGTSSLSNYYLDEDINKIICHHVYQQLRLMMFEDGCVPMSIEYLSAFEREGWGEDTQVKLALNATKLYWDEGGERDE